MRALAVLGALGSTAGLAACGDADRCPPVRPPGPGHAELVISPVSRAAPDRSALAGGADAVRSFTADLFRRQADAAGPAANVVSSPYSVAVALAMARNGAVGPTAREIDRVLHSPATPGGDPTPFDAALGALQLHLEGLAGTRKRPDGSKVTISLDVANALWGQAGEHWKVPFLDALARYYGGGVRQVDYRTAAEAARIRINAWTSDRTHGKIPHLIPAGVLDASTRLVLVNAIYLKAPWATPFRKEATSPGPFTRPDGSRVDVPMMSGGSNFSAGYARGPGWQAVDLPYSGGTLAMAVIVPDAGRLAAVEASLDGPALRSLLTGFRTSGIDLRLPRWTFRSTAGLNGILAGLGMPTAFSPRADFSGMTADEALAISAVVHEAFVAVDEDGTEAAAATAAVMAFSAAMGPDTRLTVDRPFLFVIHDTETATPLFVGRVTDPTAH